MGPSKLAFVSNDPPRWRPLFEEAEAEGFEVLIRHADPGRVVSSEESLLATTGEDDLVLFDWSVGLPSTCADRVQAYLASPERRAAAVALVYRPERGHCALFSALDDLVFPPYATNEIVIRLVRLIERRRSERDRISLGDLDVVASAHEVTIAGRRVPLTFTEFRLIDALIRARGRVVSRNELGAAVGVPADSANAAALDVHVRRMRAKLRAAGWDRIETVRKVGYRVAVDR